jgi:hypothetical protein
VVQDLANNALEFGAEGIWQVSVKATLSFTDVNFGRNVSMRLFNATTAIPGGSEAVFFVGRNTAGANLFITLNAEIPLAEVGDEFQVQVGGGDAFTGVTNIGTLYQANHISEFKGEL